jgi:hypothetical protein
MKHKERSAKLTSIFASALSILICVAILAATTFAWFTVTQDVKFSLGAGTLQLKVYGYDAKGVPIAKDGDAPEDTVTNDFDNPDMPGLLSVSDWEPSDSATRYIRVANNGSVDIKFDVHLISVDPTVFNTNATLDEVIKYRLVELPLYRTDTTHAYGEEPEDYDDFYDYAKDEPVNTAAWLDLPESLSLTEGLTTGLTYLSAPDPSVPSNPGGWPSSRVYRLDYKICSLAGNTYQGMALEVDITVSAIQAIASALPPGPGPQVFVKTENELRSTLANASLEGSTVVFLRDITLDDADPLVTSKYFNFDLNGHTLDALGHDIEFQIPDANAGTLDIANGKVKTQGLLLSGEHTTFNLAANLTLSLPGGDLTKIVLTSGTLHNLATIESF